MATKIAAQLQLTGAFGVIHTVDSHRWLTIDRILITNVSNGAKTVELCFVPPAETATSDNAVLWDYSINANSFVEIGEKQMLEPNWTIQGLASSVSSINVRVCGIEDV